MRVGRVKLGVVTFSLTILAAVAVVVAMRMTARTGGNLPPIRVEGERLIVENETPQPWHDVTVTVNAYYRGAMKRLESGGRLEAPLGNFETGLGHRFDVAHEQVMRVEVRATDGAGNPVVLNWEQGR